MGAWNMAKPIGIPNKPMFKVRLLIPRVVVKVESQEFLRYGNQKTQAMFT
jgi:hypothetical protein